MDCTKCHTWNPDDKQICWRCQAELPKPVEKKKRAPTLLLGLPIWAWIMLGAMVVFWFVTQFLGTGMAGR
jgi:predicted nucleic acid-binding Zn ribbon protein